ncbi:hypothetical protein JCM3770_000403 [Rhodotorula araucariae]
MARPLSPALSTAGESHSTPSSAARRLVRQLVVDAEANSEGVDATLYCKVVLPTSPVSPSSAHHILSLVPHSTLRTAAVHPLPLRPDDAPAAHAAGRRLGLHGALPHDSGRRVRRRSSAASDLLERLSGGERETGERPTADIAQESGEVLLLLSPSPSRPTGDTDADRPRSPAAGWSATAEFVVVLQVQARFGTLKLPRFANSITVPTPLCLRSELSFTLPTPPRSSPCPNWDLSIRPSLNTATSSDLASATQITGSFPSSPSLSLRWAPQLPPSEDVPLVIPHAALETTWMVDENGGATARVHVEGAFEFAGLREKPWIELALGEGVPPGVISCEGEDDTPVLAYELHPSGAVPLAQPVLSRSSTATTASSASTQSLSPAASPLTRPLPRELEDFASPLDESVLLAHASALSAPSSYPFTPTPTSRRRPLNPRASESRPPSFTSLFDTAPPAPPVLDTSFAEMQPSPGNEERRAAAGRARERGLSLMKTPAPFDPEASALDMSFEVSAPDAGADAHVTGDEAGGSPPESPPVPPAATLVPHPIPASQTRPARLRVQLEVGPALRRFAMLPTANDTLAAPTFAFSLVLSYSAPSLRLGEARLALPPIALSSAAVEDALVVVAPSARGAWRVEVLPDAFDSPAPTAAIELGGRHSAPPSPLPAVGGRARWATVRGAGAPAGRPVEVELRPVDGREDGEDGVRDAIDEEAQLVDEVLDFQSHELHRDDASTISDADDAVVSDVAHGADEPNNAGEAHGTDEPPSLDQSIRTERPASTPAPPSPASISPIRTERPASTPASPSPASASPVPRGVLTPETPRTTSLSHMRVEVTPVAPARTAGPTSPWRLHYRCVLAQPYTGELRAPPTPRALQCWDASGAEVAPVAGGPLGLVVRVWRVKEIVYEAQERGDTARGGVRVPVELLALEAEVAKVEVVIAVPQGYSAEAVDSDDAVHTSRPDSVTFTRFYPVPGSATALDLVFKPFEAPSPVSPVPVASPSPLAAPPSNAISLLRSLLSQAGAILLALLIYHAFAPSVHPLPAPILPSVVPPSVATSAPLLPPATHLFRTPDTHTTTATSTVQHTSTYTVVSTQHHTSISTSMATATRTVTLILSPSPSPTLSPHPTFSDDFSRTSLVPLATTVPAPHSLAHDTARDLLAAFRVWVERAKLRTRAWWSTLRGWVAL